MELLRRIGRDIDICLGFVLLAQIGSAAGTFWYIKVSALVDPRLWRAP